MWKCIQKLLLLSTLLSNSDSWYNVTNKEIKELESVDEMLLRKILSAHSKTSLELLYLETGNIPIRFILKSRRLNFLHYILNESEDALIHEVFNAQCTSPVKGDWVLTVKQDLADLDINLTFEQIKNTSKQGFKDIVKEKVKHAAFCFLTNCQQTHSKAKNLQYKSLELQSYLKSKNTTIQVKSFLFAARSRMLDVRCNFKNGLTDLSCRKCIQSDENQEHLLSCPALSDNSILRTDYQPEYNDLFCDDVKKIENIGRILKSKFTLFKNVPMCAGTTHALLQPQLQNWN